MRSIHEANPAGELIPTESQTIEGEFTGSIAGRGYCSLIHLVMFGGAVMVVNVKGRDTRPITCVKLIFGLA